VIREELEVRRRPIPAPRATRLNVIREELEGRRRPKPAPRAARR
jgi:hypothetical protein